MTSFRIRPKFEISLEQEKEQVVESFKSRVKKDDSSCNCDAIFIPGHIILRIKKADQHYWSPQLDMKLEEDENGCKIKGRYGPHPNVWTLFTLSYLALSILILFIGIIGLSRLSLDMSAHILWWIPVFVGVGIFMYLSSQIGQKLGVEQTFTLHQYMENVLKKKIQIK